MPGRPARWGVLMARLGALLLGCAGAVAAQTLPVVQVRDVVDHFDGTEVHDPYRYFEDIKSPEVAAWMKVHSDAAHATLGRIAARALECQIMANQLEAWVNQLDDNLAHGKTAIFNPEKWDPASWPASAAGHGWHEAPRGALGHWVEIQG